MLHNKKLSQGRSMVEMLGVLGIMALITALGIIAYTQANYMFKIEKVKDDVNKIKISLAAKIIDLEKVRIISSAEGKIYTENYLKIAGIKNTNKTPLGGKTYYTFWKTSHEPSLAIVVAGLETLEECNKLLLHFPTTYKGLKPSYCLKDIDGTYGLRVISPKN